MAVTIMYKRRGDGTYVVLHPSGQGYHVVKSDPLFAECEAAYTSDDDYPAEPGPPPFVYPP